MFLGFTHELPLTTNVTVSLYHLQKIARNKPSLQKHYSFTLIIPCYHFIYYGGTLT